MRPSEAPEFHSGGASASAPARCDRHGSCRCGCIAGVDDARRLTIRKAMHTKPSSDPAQEPSEPACAAQETPAAQTAAAEPHELDPWEQLEAEAAKWKELSLRTAAEMDNLRKRTAREREDAVRYANARLLEDLLPVIDNFEMGMQAAAQDKSSMIYIGMDMVRRQLDDFLAGQGVTEIATDIPFDPNLHDAVSQEAAGGDEGRILRVSRRGFMLRDRLLRPASVVVSTSPVATNDAKEGGEA